MEQKEVYENHNDHYFYDELIRYATLLFLYVIFLFFLGLPEGLLLTANHAENLRNLALVDS